MSTSNWLGDPAAMPEWNHARNRPVRDDIPYGHSNRTLRERRASSAEGAAASVARQREQERQDRLDMQRRLLPVEQAIEAVGISLDDLIALIEARQSGRY